MRIDRLPDGSARDRWTTLAIVCVALLVVVIDVTVLHIAAPSIARDLAPSSVGLLWIIDVYPLVSAPLLVPMGALGDRVGRKRLLIWGLMVFGAASALSAFAPSTGWLIAGRALMGVGGAAILPSTMSIVRDAFRDRRERVRAIGIWSGTLAGGAAVGPLVGGVLVEHFWWGSVFLVNVPLVLAIAPLARRRLPESRAERPAPWDWVGVALVAIGIFAVVAGVKQGAHHTPGDPFVVASTLGGVVLLTLFARRQLRMPDPMLDVRLFGNRAFGVAVACVLLSMFGLVGLELFIAQYLQLVLGLSPLEASVRLIPLAAATLVGSLAAAWLLHRLGTRVAIAGGLGLTSLALLPLLAVGVEDEYVRLWPAFVGIGFALEVALVAANDTIMSAIPAERAGGAAAIEDTAYELGGGLGVAVLGSIVSVIYSASLPRVDGLGRHDMVAARESLAQATDLAATLSGPRGTQLLARADEAFVHAFHGAVLVSSVLLAVSAGLAAVALRKGARYAA